MERTIADQEEEGDEHHRREDDHLDQPERAKLMKDHRPGVQEDDLDVEDDEDHGDEVEAHREPGGRFDVRHDAAFVRCRLRGGGSLGGGEQARGYEGAAREDQGQDEQ